AILEDLVDRAGLQVHGRQSGGRRDDELSSVGRVAILVKVQALAAGFIRQANDPMAGVLVDPLARQLLPWCQSSQAPRDCEPRHDRDQDERRALHDLFPPEKAWDYYSSSTAH